MAKKHKGLGVGLAAAGLAAAAGIYFLYGSKNAEKNRKKVKGWMIKAKGEALELIEQAKSLDSETYQAIIDKVIGRANGSAADKAALRRELHSYWSKIKKYMPTKKTSKKSSTRKRTSRPKSKSR